nr:MAG TPA: hypothetical protein [Herelleviridae sp.]
MTLGTVLGIIAVILIAIVILLSVIGTAIELVKEKMYMPLAVLLLLMLSGVLLILSLVFK